MATIRITPAEARAVRNQIANLNKQQFDQFQELIGFVNGLEFSWSGDIPREVASQYGSQKLQSDSGAITGMLNEYGDALEWAVSHFEEVERRLIEEQRRRDEEARQRVEGTGGAAGGNVNIKELEDFKNWVLDRQNWTDRPGGARGGIDVDGVYGEQCADISKLWYMKMYGVDSVQLSAWNRNGTTPMVSFGAQNTMNNVSGGPYAAGDIGFTIKPPSIGHTYVIMSNPDANGMVQILEQNWPTGNSPQTRTIPVSEITNGFRKK